MSSISANQLAETLAQHAAWLRGEAPGPGDDLQGVFLRGAYLQAAHLPGAVFSPKWQVNSCRDLLWVGPLGSRNDFLLVNLPTGLIKAGCYGKDEPRTLDEFATRVTELYGDAEYGREYRATVDYVRALIAARAVPTEVAS